MTSTHRRFHPGAWAVSPRIAAYDEAKVDALMQDKGIIRNRRKIETPIVNARGFMDIQRERGTFDSYIWGFTEGKTIIESGKTTSPLSDTIATDLRRRGMKFIGSTTVYAYLQAIGDVNAHEPQCWCYKTIVYPIFRQLEKH